MSNRYNLRNIRILLTEGFTEEELRRFCYEVPDFRPVYERLSQSMGKAEVVGRLIEFAERKLLIEDLLVWVKENNPARYESHQPYDDSPYSLPQERTEALLNSLKRERAIHIKNLRRLEETKAQYGPLDVPLYIQNAIDQTQENLKRIEDSISEMEAGNMRIRRK